MVALERSRALKCLNPWADEANNPATTAAILEMATMLFQGAQTKGVRRRAFGGIQYPGSSQGDGSRRAYVRVRDREGGVEGVKIR